jgi:hypothetical protein
MTHPTPQQIRELAAAAIADERSVRKTYSDPDHVKPSTWERVKRAAEHLGIEPPRQPERRAA